MTSSLIVVGLSGRTPADDWGALLENRTIIARSRRAAERVLGRSHSIAHDYDSELERETLAGVEDRVADDLTARMVNAPIAYLVPGPGWVGDVTVEALRRQGEVEITPGAFDHHIAAHTQITDALLLAQAGEQAPFDAGIRPLDATAPTLVLNWFGARVTSLAASRLRSVYGIAALPAPDAYGSVLFPARDPLDSPPSFAALEYITARLRRPDGCPWDREQSHDSLLDDFASEVSEYAEAVGSGDWPHAADELGDVLLNVIMQAQIGVEAGHFSMREVLSSITAKLVRRHPHVFAGVEAQTPEDVLAVWNRVKAQERASGSKE